MTTSPKNDTTLSPKTWLSGGPPGSSAVLAAAGIEGPAASNAGAEAAVEGTVQN